MKSNFVIQDQAKAGLKLIEDSIIDYLNNQPDKTAKRIDTAKFLGLEGGCEVKGACQPGWAIGFFECRLILNDRIESMQDDNTGTRYMTSLE